MHPGPIRTPMIEDGLIDPEQYADTVAQIPLGRVGDPIEVAYAVLYLSSDESSFVTGSELVIDGGSTAR